MSISKVKPLGNRILIKRSSAKKMHGGIILPDSAQEKPKEGDVVAAGGGQLDENGQIIPMEVSVGDKVLYSSYSGVEVKTDESDTEYLILSEDDILAVIN